MPIDAPARTPSDPSDRIGRVPGRPIRYRIAVRGHLSDRFAATFDGFLAIREPGRTVLVGPILDPAHLYGVLERLRDLGIELLELERQA